MRLSKTVAWAFEPTWTGLGRECLSESVRGVGLAPWNGETASGESQPVVTGDAGHLDAAIAGSQTEIHDE